MTSQHRALSNEAFEQSLQPSQPEPPRYEREPDEFEDAQHYCD